MKKIAIYVSAVMLTMCLSSWSIKNLFGGAQEATQTAATVTQQAATVTTQANEVANTATNITTDAQTAGQNAGKALSSLYSMYKNNGNKLNTKDVNTYAQMALLAANTGCLKENIKNTSFLKTYGQGLIAGGMGLITESNVANVTNTLTEMANNAVNSETAANVAATASSVATTASQTASTVNSLVSLFNSFKK